MSLPDSFLDLSGLKKYTKKLLKAIQDAVVVYAAGDGVNIEDETINVDNPMRGIITQEEFDSLSDDEKIKGTYLIKDTNVISGGSSFEIYDDQEQFIGSWFGKPLYRRVFEGSFGNSGQWKYIAELGPNIEFVSARGKAMCSFNEINETFSIPNMYCAVAFREDKYCALYTNSSGFANRSVVVIFEYTKTTDTIQAATVQEYTTLTSEVPINVKFQEGYTISMASATSVASIASASGGAIL